MKPNLSEADYRLIADELDNQALMLAACITAKDVRSKGSKDILDRLQAMREVARKIKDGLKEVTHVDSRIDELVMSTAPLGYISPDMAQHLRSMKEGQAGIGLFVSRGLSEFPIFNVPIYGKEP